MAYWNNRIVKKKEADDKYYYAIREVFYNDDGSIMIAEDNIFGGYHESVEELIEDFKEVLSEALISKEDVIDVDTIPEIRLDDLFNQNELDDWNKNL